MSDQQTDQNTLDRVERAVSQVAALRPPVRATAVKKANDVYRIEANGRAFYLKTYTKDWYQPKVPADTAGCVRHEASAYRILAANGLATPEIVAAVETCGHALGRPFLLLSALPGKPLTDVLQGAAPTEFDAALGAVGRYMSRMHAITFRHAGYLMDDGPAAPPDPGGWRHFIWEPDVFKEAAYGEWRSAEGKASAALLDQARELYRQEEAAIEAQYVPPHFTHGDCHAHQFYLNGGGTDWEVTGVVDMEVASAGDSGADFNKFCLEMAGRFPSGLDWWTPLMAGYGKPPPLGPMKVRLAVDAPGVTYLGRYNWPGTFEQRLAHVLGAADFRSLFDLSPLMQSPLPHA